MGRSRSRAWRRSRRRCVVAPSTVPGGAPTSTGALSGIGERPMMPRACRVQSEFAARARDRNSVMPVSARDSDQRLERGVAVEEERPDNVEFAQFKRRLREQLLCRRQHHLDERGRREHRNARLPCGRRSRETAPDRRVENHSSRNRSRPPPSSGWRGFGQNRRPASTRGCRTHELPVLPRIERQGDAAAGGAPKKRLRSTLAAGEHHLGAPPASGPGMSAARSSDSTSVSMIGDRGRRLRAGRRARSSTESASGRSRRRRGNLFQQAP